MHLAQLSPSLSSHVIIAILFCSSRGHDLLEGEEKKHKHLRYSAGYVCYNYRGEVYAC